jgi:RNA polymerase sigma-70 factor (ECF subfamily)
LVNARLWGNRERVSRRSDIEALTPSLRRYARGLAGCADAADDLVQEAILSGLRSHGIGRGPALRRRLYAILTDFNRMRAAAFDPAGYGGEPRGAVASFPDGLVEEAARPDADADPLAALDLHAREAVLLIAVEDFDYDEAADIVGASRDALIARLARARGEVRAEAQRLGPRRHLRLVS